MLSPTKKDGGAFTIGILTRRQQPPHTSSPPPEMMRRIRSAENNMNSGKGTKINMDDL
jgi:hypothetical protein